MPSAATSTSIRRTLEASISLSLPLFRAFFVIKAFSSAARLPHTRPATAPIRYFIAHSLNNEFLEILPQFAALAKPFIMQHLPRLIL